SRARNALNNCLSIKVSLSFIIVMLKISGKLYIRFRQYYNNHIAHQYDYLDYKKRNNIYMT
ncbi:MAG: hypothetical protein KAR20_25030, partial [Candidatus Heimdallarchaeota archaeon]|nr:hypothetical protein [Candidatus Heimdallarchaeota archaeon]